MCFSILDYLAKNVLEVERTENFLTLLPAYDCCRVTVIIHGRRALHGGKLTFFYQQICLMPTALTEVDES